MPYSAPRNKPQHALDITYCPVNTLKPDPRNPRAHSDRQVKQIARSIETFGFNVPVLVDASLNIIAGHGRVQACRMLGWSEVPTIRLEHFTKAQARAFMIADNRLTENSTWDDRLLGETLRELSELKLDFSLEATGFTIGEIDLRIEGLTMATEDTPDPADALPDMTDAVPVSAVGDLWLLDRHRLFCGSALEGTSYTTLLDGAQAAMVFTDPPYNVRIHGHVSGLGTVQHREFGMASGEMSGAEFLSFLKTSCAFMAQFSADGSLHYVCMDWRHLRALLEAGNAAYTELKNICVWVKDNGGMGSLYRSQHEMVCVFKKGTASHRNNVELGKHGRYRTNVWNYPGANSFSRKTEEGNLLALHPTVKPVAMVADALLDCSARGDIVLDPFLGSGTTLMAAERVGRICYSLELDPLYVDTAVRCWQRLTGKHAMHGESGRNFNDIAAETEAQHG